MARLAYYAPGVYVEEVPSARQPIAGVGTNTAGFIGLVPSTIYIPVPNPDYDPVLTQQLLDFARLQATSPQKDPNAEERRQKDIEKIQTDMNKRLEVLKAEITAINDQKPKQDAEIQKLEADVTALVAAQTALPADAKPKETSDAAQKVSAAQRKLADARQVAAEAAKALAMKTKAQDDINNEIKEGKTEAAAAPPPPASGAAEPAKKPAEQELIDYKDNPPDQALLTPSVLRPYYLVPYAVSAADCATKLCTNFSEYARLFGDFSGFGLDADGRMVPLHPGHHLLTHAVNGFFTNGGTRAFVARVSSIDKLKDVLERFTSIDDVAILAAPGLPKITDVWEELESYCEDDAHQNVFAVLDSPRVVNDGGSNDLDIEKLQYETLGNVLPRKSTHAAYYFPHIEVSDPAKRLQDSDPALNVSPKYRGRTYVAPSGHVTGIFARTDEERGVHKAPANAQVRGALEVMYYVSKPKQELLNPQGVNCIRLMDGGVTLWGARTIGGDRNGEWKYVNVRRFAGFLEESIDEGTQWVVFEPNDPKLWSKIILNVTSFLTNVWRSGALFGLTPQEAFYVKCDAELNPPEVRDLGQVITEIGVAIVRPAEFVIFRISQSTGQQQP
ncbi:phage tail sheath C-terminal domain-containing protein [Variovorax sp. J22R115]|uniref:phage tail sheath C-terminal domain-containing protein n=1 Tax=Variovorax sp. J22R115 TaxID=3053509 RepID=UPI0025758C39|nr:phage tail sheath C-terminal domain-containing protein [Variovorax sp. J22R115]MDM0047908.1 phage tail sheath subtilisin-like domain-containing protein [Variovorax sp. J22R115]